MSIELRWRRYDSVDEKNGLTTPDYAVASKTGHLMVLQTRECKEVIVGGIFDGEIEIVCTPWKDVPIETGE